MADAINITSLTGIWSRQLVAQSADLGPFADATVSTPDGDVPAVTPCLGDVAVEIDPGVFAAVVGDRIYGQRAIRDTFHGAYRDATDCESLTRQGVNRLMRTVNVAGECDRIGDVPAIDPSSLDRLVQNATIATAANVKRTRFPNQTWEIWRKP